MTQPTPILAPDLLQPVPQCRVDLDAVQQSMEFAFASGVSGGMFQEALQKSTPCTTRWEAASFASDLFLEDFVARCFVVRIGGRQLQADTAHLVRLLGSPPHSRAVVEHRRAIARELASSAELLAAFEKLYMLLVRFRTAIEGTVLEKRYDQTRRQIDILWLGQQLFDHMATGFATAESGLSVLATFGRQVQATEPYQSMAQLLRYDDNLATLDLRVRVGSDGQIRGFQVAALKENEQNIFHTSPWRRWLGKLELLFRGFRVGEGEVMARLVDAVFDGVVRYLAHFVQLLGDMELYLGALGFRQLAQAAGLGVCLPELVAAEQPRVLKALFNPLLVVHGTRAVPCDLRTECHATTVLVTGPNSGGKTRLLQSMGIAQVLAQSGMFVPAREAQMALCPALVVSLIQETRADQTEGRLGMEMIRIRALFEKLPPGAMVILDELCSGTNPSEGEQIFELVLGVLTRLRPQAFITTHFLTFAARLQREQRICDLGFFQVELDQHQQPTFQFLDGVATTSLAQRAAERLGVTGDQLLSLVERNVALAEKAAD